MRKILTALVAATSISGAAIATSSSAEAWWGWGPGAVVGGVIAGAVVGSAIAFTAVLLPLWLLRILRIRTKSLLRTGALPPRVERVRLGTRLLVCE